MMFLFVDTITDFISLIIFNLDVSFIFLDVAEPWQLGFQDPATPTMEGIIDFHNNLMFFIVLVAIFTTWILGRCLHFYADYEYGAASNSREVAMFTHSTPLEIIWTIVPAVVLLFIAVPSFALLYSMDEMIDPALTFKVVGHQWYWSYEYSDYLASNPNEGFGFDSYLVNADDLTVGAFRLLEVDNRVVLPVNTHIRLLVSAADVLHSWAVPSFGIKVDACPGRLSQASLFLKREGVFYGQCSELCGTNHAFMPIVVEAVSLENYVSWVTTKLEEV